MQEDAGGQGCSARGAGRWSGETDDSGRLVGTQEVIQMGTKRISTDESA
jgi:hypothetical protein